MPNFLSLLNSVAPVFLMIAAGYGIRRVNWLSVEADVSLMRVVVNLLFPCLILDTILGNRAVGESGNLVLAPLVGFGTVLLGYAVSYSMAPLFGLGNSRARRTFAFTTGIYNYGYLPLPLIQSVFDQSTTAVLFIHNLGVEAALWTAGIALISGASQRGGWRRALNAPVLTILVAVALHFAGARNWLPGFVLQAVRGLGAAAIPLGLILTGATFCDQMRQISMKGAAADSVGACLLRLGVLPILFLLLARWLPCPIELRRVMVVQAAMPCAVIPVLLCKHYGGDPAMALRIVLITTVCALVTIPWWIQFGMRWVVGR